MGSGDWFRTIISRKKVKLDKNKNLKGSSAGSKSKKQNEINNGNDGQVISENNGRLKVSEDVAATRIQTAFRAYMARKVLSRMKGVMKFQKLAQTQSIKKQSNSTLNRLHTWSMIQTQIRERRQFMVIEGRLNQRRLDNQMKLEAKLHDLEVEWNGGAETKEEILARIHQREEAAVKRERTLAYAFSHQWRANSSQNQGSNACELGKADWGWSWKERWIAARPWENRVQSQSYSPKKVQNKARKDSNSKMTQKPVPAKSVVNDKETVNARRLSFPASEKTNEQGSKTKGQQTALKMRESV